MPKPVKPPSKKGPKSGKPTPASTGRVTPKATGRYTPPVPRSEKVSPRWVPIVMFGSLGLGMLVILANYVSLLPGDEPSNVYLLVGLVLITIGFITATKFH
ncbi:MAG: cell division protein CrgA [Actinomycetota bacterium]|nr:cell division protein CrgA [Actinomycetota bacterium]